MASPGGTDDPVVMPPRPTGAAALPERLVEEPHDYRFFQAVRLLQSAPGEAAPVGGFTDPKQEAVRFASNQSLSYPASEIQKLEFEEGRPPRMEVNFFGLTGPVGELPVFYTAHVMERLRARDRTTADFFDIFNHRLISLFYRAWEKQRFPVRQERGDEGGLRHYLLDLLGLGTKGLQDRQQVEDSALVFFSGLLAQRPHSAQSLENLIAGYFDVPVSVVQFVGSWRRLDESSLCRLEEDPARASFSSQLGVGAVAGDEVWDPQSAARVRIGPLPLRRYLEFLPSGSAYPALRAMTRFFAGLEIDFEVQLVLKREDTPGCCLGAEGDTAPKLGWVTWVKSVPLDRDPDETMFRLQKEG